MVEKTPMYILNSLFIMVAIEVYIIDSLIGSISLGLVAVISIVVKAVGVWLCVVGSGKKERAKKGV